MIKLPPGFSLKKSWPESLAVLMLLWGLLPFNPYGYYMLLKLVVCGVSAYLAMRAAENSEENWKHMFIAIAILYNPVIQIHLTRAVWVIINLITIYMLCQFTFRKQTPEA